MTLVCVPITVESEQQAVRDAELARDLGADLVELRVDDLFTGEQHEADEIVRVLAACPLPAILTCRPTWEGGGYDGDETDRVSMFEFVCTGEHPPAYLDVELAAYTKSENIRQKINLCVAHPKQTRSVKTRLILSSHDFEGRPADLTKRLLAMYAVPSCAVAKIAFRARSLRDNLELFEITREAPKPTIALGMGEFGLMSRVLAPKFGGFLTFASLRDTTATAPGQPTVSDLLGMYRFRSIGRATKLYGVIGWPVTQSMSPAIHNAGFEAVGHDGVYLPMPVVADENDGEASYTSFVTTFDALRYFDGLHFDGASVTIPHKANLARYDARHSDGKTSLQLIGAANTIELEHGGECFNTDAIAIRRLVYPVIGEVPSRRVVIVGAGGVAYAAAHVCLDLAANVTVVGRTPRRVQSLVDHFTERRDPSWSGRIESGSLDDLPASDADLYINCTPVGMAGGPEPDGLSIPVPEMPNVDGGTTFFDTVYNPIETPMLRAASDRGCQTIDGRRMFVLQAAGQFREWVLQDAPVELFDRVCREKLGG